MWHRRGDKHATAWLQELKSFREAIGVFDYFERDDNVERGWLKPMFAPIADVSAKVGRRGQINCKIIDADRCFYRAPKPSFAGTDLEDAVVFTEERKKESNAIFPCPSLNRSHSDSLGQAAFLGTRIRNSSSNISAPHVTTLRMWMLFSPPCRGGK